MNCFSPWHFIRENAVFVAPILSGLVSLGIALWVHYLQRESDKKKKRQELAVCWRAVLLELSLALDRMQETARHLIRNVQQPSPITRFHKSDILIHQGLLEGFLLKASDQAGTDLVLTVHQDLHLFLWNVNQGIASRVRTFGAPGAIGQGVNRSELKAAITAFDEAAIWFACCRHGRMLESWRKSVSLFARFCREHGLDQGEELQAPNEIPKEWLREETVDWKVSDLPPVGDRTWQP